MQCDALIFDDISRTDTYPTIDIRKNRVDIGHEASVSKISDEQLFYLQSRGLSEQSARALIVNGFIDAFVQLLPMEYAVEINRLDCNGNGRFNWIILYNEYVVGENQQKNYTFFD